MTDRAFRMTRLPRPTSDGRPTVPLPQRAIGDWIQGAGKLIAKHPAASLAVGLSVGVLLGWLVKRR